MQRPHRTGPSDEHRAHRQAPAAAVTPPAAKALIAELRFARGSKLYLLIREGSIDTVEIALPYHRPGERIVFSLRIGAVGGRAAWRRRREGCTAISVRQIEDDPAGHASGEEVRGG